MTVGPEDLDGMSPNLSDLSDAHCHDSRLVRIDGEESHFKRVHVLMTTSAHHAGTVLAQAEQGKFIHGTILPFDAKAFGGGIDVY